jgi:Flp pilus assembly protein TadG
VRRERGSVIAESAITLPILFLLLLATFGFGVIWANYQMMTDAAREGARLGVTAPPGSDVLPTPAVVAQKVCVYMSGNLGVANCSNYSSGGTTPPTLGTCATSGGTIPSGEDIYVSQCNVTQPNRTVIKFTEVDVRKTLKFPFIPQIPLHTTAVMRNETN